MNLEDFKILMSPMTGLFDHFRFVLLVLVVGWILKYVAKRIIRWTVQDPIQRFQVTRFVKRAISIFSGIIILGYLVALFGDRILAGLTIISTALVIALREYVLSAVGRIHIFIKAPFQLGDRIEINDVTGDVLDIQMLSTTLMEVSDWGTGGQSTGRVIRVPNNWVFLYAVKNYTHGFDFIWNEIVYILPPDADWQRAREIMLECAEESSHIIEPQVRAQLHLLAQELLIHWTILTPFVFVKYRQEGVELTLRYLTKVMKRRATEHAFHITFLERFTAEGIRLSNPHPRP